MSAPNSIPRIGSLHDRCTATSRDSSVAEVFHRILDILAIRRASLTADPKHREGEFETTILASSLLDPNHEASLLRLVTAMVAEISDEWEIGRAYLVMASE